MSGYEKCLHGLCLSVIKIMCRVHVIDIPGLFGNRAIDVKIQLRPLAQIGLKTRLAILADWRYEQQRERVNRINDIC